MKTAKMFSQKSCCLKFILLFTLVVSISVSSTFLVFKILPNHGFAAFADIPQKTMVMLGLGILFILGLSFLVTKHIVSPLCAIGTAIKNVAAGDLTYEPRLAKDDELGILAWDFQQMLTSLRQNIGRTILASHSLHHTTGNLHSEVTNMDNNSKRAAGMLKTFNLGLGAQRREIENISSRLDGLSCTAQEIAGFSENTADFASDINQRAVEGKQMVGNTVRAMRDIETTAVEAEESVLKLQEEADRIASIIYAISEISARTNLLALNAGIEAARAGEQGRGFAVVANEIKKLAQRSNNSTHEIITMIDNMQHSVQDVVTAIKAGKRNVNQGTSIVNQVGSSLEEILSLVSHVSEKISSINLASQQQSRSLTEVASSMGNMKNIAASAVNECGNTKMAVENTAKMISDFQFTFQELKKSAAELLDIMAHYKLGETPPQKERNNKLTVRIPLPEKA